MSVLAFRKLWRRVYYTVLFGLVPLLGFASAALGQVDLSVEPSMTKGAPGATVVIVEFSDYQ